MGNMGRMGAVAPSSPRHPLTSQWRRRASLRENVLPHFSHPNGLTARWIRLCRFRSWLRFCTGQLGIQATSTVLTKLWTHSSHLNGLSTRGNRFAKEYPMGGRIGSRLQAWGESMGGLERDDW